MDFRKLADFDTGDIFGCYVRGHFDKEEVEQKARQWLKKDWEKDMPEAVTVKQGYYKVIPTGNKNETTTMFSQRQLRGSFAVTQITW